jgi:glycerol-3-phosphate acyltransferase PlsX
VQAVDNFPAVKERRSEKWPLQKEEFPAQWVVSAGLTGSLIIPVSSSVETAVQQKCPTEYARNAELTARGNSSKSSDSEMIIAVDAMGGDNAPEEIVRGAEKFALASEKMVLLVGSRARIEAFMNPSGSPFIKILDVDGDIDKDEITHRRLPASLRETFGLVARGEADCAVTFCDTANAVVAGVRVLKRLSGIRRPAIPVAIPRGDGFVVLVDAGANPSCGVEDLISFGLMGAFYAASALGIENPRVGLLNIGAEGSKGHNVIRMARTRMEKAFPFPFAGNVEGHEMFSGKTDVLVCDGFVGNVLLKGLEGLASHIFELSGSHGHGFHGSGLAERFSPEIYGGAPLLGVNGTVIVGHGRSGRDSVTSSLILASRLQMLGLPQGIGQLFRNRPFPSE